MLGDQAQTQQAGVDALAQGSILFQNAASQDLVNRLAIERQAAAMINQINLMTIDAQAQLEADKGIETQAIQTTLAAREKERTGELDRLADEKAQRPDRWKEEVSKMMKAVNEKVLNDTQKALEWLSILDPTGIISAVNGAIYLMRGNNMQAAICFASALPFVGKAVGGAAALAGRAVGAVLAPVAKAAAYGIGAAARTGGRLAGAAIAKGVALKAAAREGLALVRCKITGNGCFAAGTQVVMAEDALAQLPQTLALTEPSGAEEADAARQKNGCLALGAGLMFVGLGCWQLAKRRKQKGQQSEQDTSGEEFVYELEGTMDLPDVQVVGLHAGQFRWARAKRMLA